MTPDPDLESALSTVTQAHIDRDANKVKLQERIDQAMVDASNGVLQARAAGEALETLVRTVGVDLAPQDFLALYMDHERRRTLRYIADRGTNLSFINIGIR